MVTSDFFLGIVNGLGVFALVTMVYGRILRGFEAGLLQNLAFGLMFGTGAGLAIANTVQLAPGLFIDPRAVMLVLAAPFGGPVAAALAAAITSGVRFWGGGVGVYAGITNIIATAAIGMIFAKFVFEANRPKTFRELLYLGLASNVPLLAILAVPIENATTMFLHAIGPLAIADTIGVLVLGRVLCNERKAFFFGRELAVEASTDPLTGLPNRRQFERMVSVLMDGACKTGEPISVLVVDIDLFKRVNDRFGHDVGDTILVEVADVIRQHLRAEDVVARFGGEEIVIAMPATGVAAASVIADRIRSVVDWDVFHGGRDTGNVTVSIGMATHQGSVVSFRTLFKAADDALFRAKERGRNRVEIASPMAFDRVA